MSGGLQLSVRKDPRNMIPLFMAYVVGFESGAKDAHRKWVLLVNEYLLKYSRTDTGRSRAGWTAFPDAQGYNYQRSMPLANHYDQQAEQEGKGKSHFVDADFHTELINNVDYVDYMNQKYGIFSYSPVAINSGNIMSEKSKKGFKLFGVNEFGNRVTKGIRFEDKIPTFEAFADGVYDKFLKNAKTAYEQNQVFNPGPIEQIFNDPPMNP